VDFVYLNVNQAFEKLTGLKDVVGRRFCDVLPTIRQTNPELSELYCRVVSTGKPERHECYLEPLASWFACSVYCPEEDHLVIVFDNITQRKHAEADLGLERERLRQMVATSQVGIAFTSPDGSMHEVNEALLQMIGWTRREFEEHGLNWQAILPLEYHAQHDEHLNQLTRCGAVGPVEEALLHKDGRRIPAVCNRVLLRDGEQTQHVAFVMDVTERRRLESALHDTTEAERARIGRDLHDGLGQQLGGILYLSRMLQSDLEARRYPDAQRVAEIHRLIKESLGLTRDVVRGLHPVPPGPEGLMTALEGLAERFINGHKLEFIFACAPPVLIEDVRIATHLFRIAQEAVANALKHSHATRIEIALWQDGETIHLVVRDNGIGMARGPSGEGLGMHTMKQRALLLGGLLNVQAVPDGGVTVSCDVPRIHVTQMHSSKFTP
jgi:PAS domain S-box-containing protein